MHGKQGFCFAINCKPDLLFCYQSLFLGITSKQKIVKIMGSRGAERDGFHHSFGYEDHAAKGRAI